MVSSFSAIKIFFVINKIFQAAACGMDDFPQLTQGNVLFAGGVAPKAHAGNAGQVGKLRKGQTFFTAEFLQF